ncbi:hypothetical protein D3C78_1613630 [compost metagenome]
MTLSRVIIEAGGKSCSVSRMSKRRTTESKTGLITCQPGLRVLWYLPMRSTTATRDCWIGTKPLITQKARTTSSRPKMNSIRSLSLVAQHVLLRVRAFGIRR